VHFEAPLRTPLGSLRRSPDLLVSWGGEYPLPPSRFHALDAFCVKAWCRSTEIWTLEVAPLNPVVGSVHILGHWVVLQSLECCHEARGAWSLAYNLYEFVFYIAKLIIL